LSIGLDCFSPILTCMVGQDLGALDGIAGWVKIKAYPRAPGSAGISFELLRLAERFTFTGLGEIEAMCLLAETCVFPIPADKAGLKRTDFGSDTISKEIQLAYNSGVTNLLAGIAMVRMDDVHESSPEQIQSDLETSRIADGLVISWDLWFTPLEYLDRIRTVWS
jgi:hypothetical protein